MWLSQAWEALRSRNLIGSDAGIVLSCFGHFYEAASFILTTNANGSIGLASLLFFCQTPTIAASALIFFAVTAALAEWVPGLSRGTRSLMFFGQAVLLLMEQIGALYFVVTGHYADCSHYTDCVFRPSNYIFNDQMARIGMPFWYVSAILARVRE